MNADNQHAPLQNEIVDLAQVVSTREARSVNKKLAVLKLGPIRGATETRIAAATWKVNDALVAHGLLTSLVALIALGDAMNGAHTVPGWVAFAVVVIFGFLAAAVLYDKRNWEAAKAVLEYRLSADLSLVQTARE